VDATAQVDRVRSQSETRPPQQLLAPGAASTPPTPGRPTPRGSLLDLSV